MADLYTIQPDFSGGELSPRMYGRVDTERYRRGFKESANFVVTPQGSLLKRSGFQKVSKLAESNKPVRVFPLEVYGRDDFIVEVTPDGIFINDGEGRFKTDPVSGATYQLVRNPNFSEGITGLANWDTRVVSFSVAGQKQVNVSANNNFISGGPKVLNNQLYLLSAMGNTEATYFYAKGTDKKQYIYVALSASAKMERHEISQRINLDGISPTQISVTVRLSQLTFIDGVTKLPAGTVVTGFTKHNNQRAPLEGPLPYGTLAHTNYGTNTAIPANYQNTIIKYKVRIVVSSEPFGSGTKWLDRLVDGHIGQIQSTVDLPATLPPNMYVTVYPETIQRAEWALIGTPIGDGRAQPWRYSSAITSVLDSPGYYVDNDKKFMPDQCIGIVDSISVNAVDGPAFEDIDLASPYTDAQIKDVKFAADPSGSRIILFHPEVPPKQVQYTKVGSSISFSITNAVVTGIDGLEAGSYPSGGYVYGGRLWMFGSPKYPSRIWASKLGDYSDFNVGTSPSDAIDIKLATKGSIHWMKSAQEMLVVGASDGCYVMYSQGAGISPSDVGVRKFTEVGSADRDAVEVSGKIAYIAKGARSVMMVNSSNDLRSAVAVNISKRSDHIFQSGIKYLVASRDPFTSVIAVLSNTEWAHCTIDVDDPEMAIMAWHRHSMASGAVIDFVAADSSDGQDLFAAVSRPAGVFLERMDTNPYNAQYLDFWSRKTIVPDATDPTKYYIPDMQDYVNMPVTIVQAGNIVPTSPFSGDGIDASTPIDIDPVSGTASFNCSPDLVRTDVQVFVGATYESYVRLMRKEMPNMFDSLATSNIRINKAVVDLIDSYPPLVNNESIPDRDTMVGSADAQPTITGPAEYSLSGWEDRGEIFIYQSLPYRLEISSIAADVFVERR